MWFRKKPVVVEAVQFDGSTYPVFEDAIPDMIITRSGTVLIETLEGMVVAVRNDWIIRGVKGEFYSCKPDIFAATYEPVAQRRRKEQP